jgi:hypothetical protein
MSDGHAFPYDQYQESVQREHCHFSDSLKMKSIDLKLLLIMIMNNVANWNIDNVE